MLEYNSIIPSLKIERIVFKGFGLGHYLGHAIFVHQGLPGDDVEAKIIHKRGDVYFAEIFSYNTRSPLQIPVKCEVFKMCGGCDWLHVNYQEQLRIKENIVRDYFNDYIKKGTVFEEITASPESDFYRNKVFLPVSKDRMGKLYAGIFSRRSHNVVPIQKCYLQPEGSEEIIKYALDLLNKANITPYDEKTDRGVLRHIGIRYSFSENNYILILVTKGNKLPFDHIFVREMNAKFPEVIGIVQNINSGRGNNILGDDYKVLFGTEYLIEKIRNVTYRIHYSSFFQVNTHLTHLILDYIKTHVNRDDVVVDAYSGIGTIGLFLADSVKQIFFLENHARSVQDGIENCKINHVNNYRYYEGDVENLLETTLKSPSVNTVILDPPRKGIEKSVADVLINSKISKIIYMSCDISTQKRDLDRLIKGGFKVQSIKPFDMFPHTFHTENVAVLIRE